MICPLLKALECRKTEPGMLTLLVLSSLSALAAGYARAFLVARPLEVVARPLEVVARPLEVVARHLEVVARAQS